MEQEQRLEDDLSLAQEDVWRKEVQARVTGYRSRKGRKLEGAFSMRFPFPSAELDAERAEGPAFVEFDPPPEDVVAEYAGGVHIQLAELALAPVMTEVVENSPDGLFEAQAQPNAAEEVFEVPVIPAPRPRAKRKVIAFPKPATVEPVYPLADPALPEQPRIFEVPEELETYPTTPLLDGLQFPVREAELSSRRAEDVELPLQPVSIAHRIRAGAVDCGVVLAGTFIFAAAGFKFLPKVTVTKPLLLTLAAIPVLLWAVYQYLLLMYGGRTAGMQFIGLRLRGFKGDAPSRRQRRSRIFGLYFSTASLMMGLLWALVDVDTLCWHDRTSGTYMTEEATRSE